VTKLVLEIDGNRFTTLEGFYDEISRKVIPGYDWGQNLDAFNDVLRGGFGTPEEGFRLVWRNHDVSRKALGHAETARQLALRLERCHPSNHTRVAADLAAAQEGRGSTVFDWLVEIIEGHDNLELVLS
jgi:RNAse (barnase) inhibitor barstar